MGGCLVRRFVRPSLWWGFILADIYAQQVKTELVHIPARGKIPGHLRDLGKMILDKAKNRTYVSEPQHPQMHASSGVAEPRAAA